MRLALPQTGIGTDPEPRLAVAGRFTARAQSDDRSSWTLPQAKPEAVLPNTSGVTETGQGEGGVDRMVRKRFFTGSTTGVFVDVGAAGPNFLSMSALYRELGWRVIAVEPNPDFVAAHRAAGHEVYAYACADRDEDDVDFELVDSHNTSYKGGSVSFESFSSLEIKPAYRALKDDLDVRRIKVDVRRLDRILSEHAPDIDRIDIVSVDVEGWELEVLDGLSFERYRPIVVIVENLFAEASYRRALHERGYVLWRRRSPNDIYVAHERLSYLERAAARIRGRLSRST
jgi:FkbM family methyltransferase